MAPGREILTILDSDEDNSPTKVGARTQHKSRDKTSRRKHNGAFVDLTRDDNDDDGLDAVRSSMPDHTRTRSPLFTNPLSRMHPSPRPRPAANQKATSFAVSLSDDEDDLPDDPTPKPWFARPTPRSDHKSQPKVASSSSSLKNVSRHSSPNKRSRDSDEAAQRRYAKEKRRRVAADEESVNRPDVRAIRSKQSSQSHGGSRRSSPSKASAIGSPSVAGAADESRAGTTADSETPKQTSSAKSQGIQRHLVEIAEDRRKQHQAPRSKPVVPTLDARAESRFSDRNPDGKRKERQTEVSDTALNTSNGLFKAPSRDVDDDLRDRRNGSTVLPKQRKETTAVLASTLNNGGDDHNPPKPASPSRRSPPADWTSAGASPSSQLHREAGGSFEEPDHGVHVPQKTEPTSDNQTLEPGPSTIQADEAVDDHGVPAIPVFPVERQVERVLGKYYQEMREDTDYFTKAWLKRSRRSIELHCPKQVTAQSNSPSDQPSVASAVFARLRAAATRQPITATAKISGDSLRFSVDVYNGANKPARSYVKARHIKCNVTSIANDVPEYAHYVSLQTNILAPNTTTSTLR